MVENPTVSIIVPVFNVEDYLEKCLDSLISQTLTDIEIICIDDGSSDASCRILDSYAEKDERIIAIHKGNEGVSRARNIGLDRARGEYVLFVDSDDYVARRTCERLSKSARENGAQIVVFGGKTFPTMPWADASFANRFAVYKNDGMQALLEERGSNPLMCNKLYERALLEENRCRFNESLILGEDNAFQFEVFPLANTIIFIPDKLYYYRIRKDSAVSSLNDDHAEKSWRHLDVVRYILRIWKERGYIEQKRNQILAWSMLFLYREASQMPFNERADFSKAFLDLMQGVFPGYDSGAIDMDEATTNRISFMSTSHAVEKADPLVTLIVDSLDGASVSSEVMRGIELQTEQRYEVLILDDEWEERSSFHLDMEKLVKRDSRVRLLHKASVPDVLKAARGRFLVFLFSNEALELTAFEQLTKMAEEASRKSDGIDLITFSDSSRLIGTCEALNFFEPREDGDVDSALVLSPCDFKEGPFEAITLMRGNKFFSLEHLRNCQKECGANSWVQLYIHGVLGASFVMPTLHPFLTIFGVRFEDSRRAREVSRKMTEECSSALEAIRERNVGKAIVRSVEKALLKQGVCSLRFVRGTRCFEECHSAIRSFCKEEDLFSRADELLDEDMRKAASLLHVASAEEFEDRQNSDIIDKMILENCSNLALVGDLYWRRGELEKELEGFESSISFRIGRKLTFVPRMILNFIGRK